MYGKLSDDIVHMNIRDYLECEKKSLFKILIDKNELNLYIEESVNFIQSEVEKSLKKGTLQKEAYETAFMTLLIDMDDIVYI